MASGGASTAVGGSVALLWMAVGEGASTAVSVPRGATLLWLLTSGGASTDVGGECSTDPYI